MKALTFTLSKPKSDTPTRQLVESPIPKLKRGEILVRVHYAGLNHLDLENSNGDHNRAIAKALKRSPVVSGIEMAGVAESDGERIKKGDKVFGYTNIFRGPYYHAQYVTTPEENLALVPDNATLEGATSIIGGALTSINAFERIARLESGSKVLITGATGSVGITAVQLATHLDAEVSAVCHSTQTQFVLSQGAVHAYAYDQAEMPEATNQFDLVFDTAPSLSFVAAGKYLATRGRYITTMPHLDLTGCAMSLISRRKWGFLLEYDTDAARMERLRELISRDAFTPVIDSVYEFSAAIDAFAKQQKPGKRGKILIDFRSA